MPLSANPPVLNALSRMNSLSSNNLRLGLLSSHKLCKLVITLSSSKSGIRQVRHPPTFTLPFHLIILMMICVSLVISVTTSCPDSFRHLLSCHHLDCLSCHSKSQHVPSFLPAMVVLQPLLGWMKLHVDS